MRYSRTLSLVVLTGVAALASCTRPATIGQGASRTEDAKRLESLPPTGTYAWVAPSKLFPLATARDDSASTGSTFESRRERAAEELRSQGWRETHPDSAQYLLSIARSSQTLVGQQYQDSRSSGPTIWNCEPAPSPANNREACSRATSSSGPTGFVSTRREVRALSFGIRRVSDGAMVGWSFANLLPSTESKAIARNTRELLKQGKP